jgi:hypothetical protein
MGILKGNNIKANTLTKQELNYILSSLAENTFQGKDVLLLSAVVEKLQSQLEARK